MRQLSSTARTAGSLVSLRKASAVTACVVSPGGPVTALLFPAPLAVGRGRCIWRQESSLADRITCSQATRPDDAGRSSGRTKGHALPNWALRVITIVRCPRSTLRAWTPQPVARETHNTAVHPPIGESTPSASR
jgi:hypothetical protein